MVPLVFGNLMPVITPALASFQWGFCARYAIWSLRQVRMTQEKIWRTLKTWKVIILMFYVSIYMWEYLMSWMPRLHRILGLLDSKLLFVKLNGVKLFWIYLQQKFISILTLSRISERVKNIVIQVNFWILYVTYQQLALVWFIHAKNHKK